MGVLFMHRKLIILLLPSFCLIFPMKRTCDAIATDIITQCELKFKKIKLETPQTRKRPNPYTSDRKISKKLKTTHGIDLFEEFEYELKKESHKELHACTPGNMAIAFIRATMDNNIEQMETLLQQGAFIDANISQHGWTALMIATLQRKTAIVQWLLEHGANMYRKNTYGECAWDFAQYRVESLPILQEFQEQNLCQNFDHMLIDDDKMLIE